MPFSSMVQEMKGEIGAISRRGLLLRSRPHGAGRVQRVEEPDEAALRESSWANVPPELMREPGGAEEGRGGGGAVAGTRRRRGVRRRLPWLEARHEGDGARSGGVWEAHLPHLC